MLFLFSTNGNLSTRKSPFHQLIMNSVWLNQLGLRILLAPLFKRTITHSQGRSHTIPSLDLNFGRDEKGPVRICRCFLIVTLSLFMRSIRQVLVCQVKTSRHMTTGLYIKSTFSASRWSRFSFGRAGRWMGCWELP